MKQSIEKGKTLLIDGPACIALYSGALRAFGAPIKVGEHIIIRRGRRIPIEAIEDSQIEILLGNSASFSLIDENPIPDSWRNAADKILSIDGRVEIVVLGNVDSGKTSFCTYLANVAFERGRSVALIDGDLGQSDIGPPGTLGLSLIRSPVIDPFNLQPDYVIFIGNTSPSSVVQPTINGLVDLRDKALNMGSSFVVINTDGWVEGLDAINYKRHLIRRLQPNFVVIIGSEEPLKPLIDSLSSLEVNIILVETPRNVKRRDRETRKMIREASYRKYLRDAKVRSYPISWIKVDGHMEIAGKPDQALKERIEGILGEKIVYCEGTQNSIILVLDERANLSNEARAKLSAELNRPIRIMRKGEERGLLVALEDGNGRFLGIGTIQCIDFERGTLKVYTNVEGSVLRVHIGQIRLDDKGNEVEIISRST
ncbi:hypothetical protein KEJ14_02540 [Candidatus Bathyarchaeota archaeon]|nr:hypothetical protein [Candidatus Bathyarchaeota archaeon]